MKSKFVVKKCCILHKTVLIALSILLLTLGITIWVTHAKGHVNSKCHNIPARWMELNKA